MKLNKTFLHAFYFANVQIKTKCKCKDFLIFFSRSPHEKIAFAHPVQNYLGGTRLFLLICNNDSCTIPRKIDENTNWNIIWLNQSGLVQFFFAKTNKQYNFNLCRYVYYLHSNKSNHEESWEVHPADRLLVNCIALQPDIDL